MQNQELVEQGKKISAELAQIIRELPDSDVGELLGHGVLDELLKAIFDPSHVKDYDNIGQLLITNKNRLRLLALMRYGITRDYSFEYTDKDGDIGFVSPWYTQDYEDGVMFLSGPKPWEGLLGLFRNGRESYAIATRDMQAGEQVGPGYLTFIDVEDLQKVELQVPIPHVSDLDNTIHAMQVLLNNKDNTESNYQELLEKYPWILGAQYTKVQRHTSNRSGGGVTRSAG